MKHILFIFLSLQIVTASYSQDYQYQYFNKDKDKYVPFSDYIPKVKLHFDTVPHFVEDYYELYSMRESYNETSLRKNIERLKTALQCKFRHPSLALVRIESEDEYLKYRKLLFMHINILIMRNYMSIAAGYDMLKINFYNRDFTKEINESMNIAERLYKEAIPYWEKAREYAMDASAIKITTGLSFMESERYSIKSGELDYGKIIEFHIRNLYANKEKLNRMAVK